MCVRISGGVGPSVTDLSDLPAVPPEDRGGDERIGYRAGGILLLVVGWGFGVVVNILLHRMAPASGEWVGPWRIYPTLGVYALGLVGLGAVAGVVGLFMIWLGQRSPKGKFVLPEYPYPYPGEGPNPPP
jgi:hypothetical protein